MIARGELPTMRIFYLDPGLLNNVGHYATYCRSISGELRKRGITPIVLAYKGIDPALGKELDAHPFFEKFTNWFSDGDPICGQLNAFHIAAEATHRDLARLSDIGPTDFVYFSSARPAQFYSAILWLASLTPDRRPHILIEFANDPGLDRTADNKLALRDPRVDPTAMLWRFSGCRLSGDISGRLHMVTFERVMSEVYSALLKHPVSTLPTMLCAAGPVHQRGQMLPLTVSVLGVQRANKGYHLIPDVIRGLLSANPTVRFLVHNSAPAQMAEQQATIRELAAKEPRIIVDERPVEPDVWNQLLKDSDLIVCPYHPETFYASPSAVALEAVANGIPFVGPANTTVGRLVTEYGSGTVFERFEAGSILEGINRILANFDHFAKKAVESAEKFALTQGPVRAVDEILRYRG
jgi:glycosyltransferase involved in cell wall biosynthesis